MDEKQLFEDTVHRYYDDIFRFAFSLTKTEADAADLVQQTFLKYARKGEQLQDPKKMKSWLFTVTRNEFIDIQRKKKRFPEVELENNNHDESVPGFADRQADWSIMLSALKSIKECYREPLSLYYFEGYTYPEIAEFLEIPIGTVMSRLSRGKKTLKSILETSPASESPTHG